MTSAKDGAFARSRRRSRSYSTTLNPGGTSHRLDFIGLVVTAALMVLVVNTLTIFMDASRAARITLAAAIGVWIGLAAAVAQAGWLTIARPVPVVGVFVVAPL